MRLALAACLADGPATLRALAQRTMVGATVAAATIDNMRRAGEVEVIGTERAPGVKRPVSVYALSAGSAPLDPFSALACAWSTSRRSAD